MGGNEGEPAPPARGRAGTGSTQPPAAGALKSASSGDWLVGGGEMAKVIKAKDWSRTPLGPIASWPQSLRTVVSLVQASNSPISLAWGRGHAQIYNDGYWPICGDKHPTSMGQDFRECWASAFPVIGEAYASAWSGKSAYLENMRMFLDRYGFLEETWFTFSFSPITDESGEVGGLFHPVTEVTEVMLAERRTALLRDMASRAGKAKTTQEVFAAADQVLVESGLDVPFAVFYSLEGEGGVARLIGQSGVTAGTPASPVTLEPGGCDAPWPVADVARTGGAVRIDDARERLAGMKVGPYPELPKTAFALPIRRPGREEPAVVIVAGASARLPMTAAYRAFYDLLAGAVSTAFGNARAYEEARRKAEALQEIDRAKTLFFSNVSHEFRTPLTLMLGPLEDELAEREDPLPPARRERLATAHRNSLRLLKLVNTLLDFARIEAGRIQATYRPTDLASDTAELSSVFRSAVERAGLTLSVDCPPLPEPIYVDREMWEKILLNLLSNAFKHTFDGGIAVRLRPVDAQVSGGSSSPPVDGGVVLTVEDTGVGIPEAELPRLFERFHRVKEAKSRSHEGTGIGLALVQELVRLHDGTVRVASEVGKGTTFTVTLKAGSAHLPSDRIGTRATGTTAATRAAAFVEEALHWLPERETDAAGSREVAGAVVKPDATSARVVWADDNADMREYVRRLLCEHYQVQAFADGAEALAAAKRDRPDLVLTDVMMPNLDGFGLLRELRSDPATRTIPVILLSARAGEEAALEGLDAGADDYLVKPFSARELLARVRTHLELSRARQAWAAELERANKELEAFSYSVSHDLRAPLRAIDGFSKALLTEYAPRFDDQGRHYLQRVRSATQRMGALIDDLLHLARLNRSQLRREPTDLTELANGVVADLTKRDPSRVLTVEVAQGMQVHADARLLTVALENLVGNAWKFTAKTNGAVISVGRETEGPETRFFVRDNGAGFDMKYADRLFSPFQRLHKASEYEGTGIGLATVARIVARHGGRIWAQAKVGEGATFYFTLGGIH